MSLKHGDCIWFHHLLWHMIQASINPCVNKTFRFPLKSTCLTSNLYPHVFETPAMGKQYWLFTYWTIYPSMCFITSYTYSHRVIPQSPSLQEQQDQPLQAPPMVQVLQSRQHPAEFPLYSLQQNHIPPAVWWHLLFSQNKPLCICPS